VVGYKIAGRAADITLRDDARETEQAEAIKLPSLVKPAEPKRPAAGFQRRQGGHGPDSRHGIRKSTIVRDSAGFY
jgi:hypothetical protein